MALALKFFTCLVLMVCIVASVDAKITTCATVRHALKPCVKYLTHGGAVPKRCCAQVTTLKNTARTTWDRKQICVCLKLNAQFIHGLNETLAASLPAKCGLTIPYPISKNTSCFKVE